MGNTDFDADCGFWDDWDMSLSDVALVGDVVSGTSTLYDCSFNDATAGVGGSLAWMISMEDETGGALDCAILGFDSEAYFNTFDGNSCICFDSDGVCTN